jgi:hypothetical protein
VVADDARVDEPGTLVARVFRRQNRLDFRQGRARREGRAQRPHARKIERAVEPRGADERPNRLDAARARSGEHLAEQERFVPFAHAAPHVARDAPGNAAFHHGDGVDPDAV